ncbi:MAG: hypothetical protein JO056_11420 [Alphaproteobacteria bacterium]|nr:hypothetical protein [Alphaproteobacteria bacterium]
MRRSDLKAIVLGGLVAGTIDIGAASLITMLSPVFILKFIAGGLLGKAALAGGMEIALLGLLLQWLMSILIAAIYVFASRWLPASRSKWIVFGLCYGATVFFVMNYAVVPLSAWHRIPHFTLYSFCANLAAMLLFGLIVGFFARGRGPA